MEEPEAGEDDVMRILGMITAKECDCVIAIREHATDTEHYVSRGSCSTKLGLATILQNYIEAEVYNTLEEEE